MQLPRGTFHSIKRGVVLHSLLDDMEKSGFTGYCSIRYDAVNCTLVLQSGNYILADYEQREGDSAWLKLRELLTKKVDASLTSLSDAQLKLCIEFNSHAVLLEPVRRTRHHAVKPVAPQVRSGALVKPVSHQGKVSPKSPQEAGKPVQTAMQPQDIIAKTHAEDIEKAEIIDRDFGSLDEMDLDEMTKKIRESCKVTVEKLHLEHLIKNLSE